LGGPLCRLYGVGIRVSGSGGGGGGGFWGYPATATATATDPRLDPARLLRRPARRRRRPAGRAQHSGHIRTDLDPDELIAAAYAMAWAAWQAGETAGAQARLLTFSSKAWRLALPVGRQRSRNLARPVAHRVIAP